MVGRSSHKPIGLFPAVPRRAWGELPIAPPSFAGDVSKLG